VLIHDGALLLMRILYAALDQTVPGTLGGSVHVQAVAEGLAALGHDVHVATTPGGAWPDGRVTWHAMSPPLGLATLRWTRCGRLARLARRIGAAVVMERYYNFGGEGVLAAHRLGLPAVLEVNAPVIDYPGSAKAKLDRALLVEPMRRWREYLCRLTNLFVTPSAAILPAWVDRDQVLESEWGADIEKFHPDAGTHSAPFPRDPARVWCVFAGAFRPWHGAPRLAEALARMHREGDRRFGALFIGDGPDRSAAERLLASVPGVLFTGSMPHDELPAYLAASDIGVAPFDPSRHPPLQIEFFWSPLKIFEYMASGLPVVTPSLPRLRSLIEHDREGMLYDPGEPRALDAALRRLAEPACRRKLGAAARARAVREFSWQAHCAALDERLKRLRPEA
jgi:glycosyltransferase involved in cell wall biosynthesis